MLFYVAGYMQQTNVSKHNILTYIQWTVKYVICDFCLNVDFIWILSW